MNAGSFLSVGISKSMRNIVFKMTAFFNVVPQLLHNCRVVRHHTLHTRCPI